MKDYKTDLLEFDKEKVLRILNALFPGAKFYLYGSRARGTHRETSDFDIAVDAGEKLNRILIGEARDVLNDLIMPFRFDIVDIHYVPASLKIEIEKDKILWNQKIS